ncbi:LAMI_0B06546g1_1 [Lachancea mirantina]|uniref:LAMI_0B06546g1_1 n=1 Tax=Lachancea mirantina TaxID=1230905 RepID=A0A1G4IXA4_9SACH|nr:LAMI_0B06546g1_1 [Lachancea mirantina]
MALKKLVSFQVDYAPQYHLTKFISPRTKLQLVHINNTSSPLVQGYFAVATECATDSGVPHTLEHLVFMGSEQHPYKGLLDTAGNLCMSLTNAWTATDQTVYTLTSAGWKGFQKLLPVYLDHILNPTITDEACMTEVYHFDPNDMQEKGVVFSEMEGIESQSWFITMLEKQRQLFPEGSGYRSETGGLTPQLRDLTNKEIREFHRDMYSPDNLCLIISGNVPEDELVKLVEEFDATLPAAREERKRPFLNSENSQIPATRSEISESLIEFPETDETQGEVLLSWIGPFYESHTENLAVSLIMDYFTETSLAPFNKELIEVKEPCSNFTENWTDDYMRTILNLNFHGVPADKLQATRTKILNILQTHKIDLQRMKQVLENEKWEYILKCEKMGATTLGQICITDFLYGPEDGRILESSLATLADYDLLSQWSQAQWQDLLQVTFLDNKPVIVLGKPSAEMYTQMDKDKAERIKDIDEKLGSQGKEQIKQKLKEAVEHNSTPIPNDLLNEFAIENLQDSVKFIETKGASSFESRFNDQNDGFARKVRNSRPENFPFAIHFEQLPSKFIELRVLLNTANLTDIKLLPLYHVLCELFSMPMKNEDGSIVKFDDVIATLKEETVDSQIGLGMASDFPDLIEFKISCRNSQYQDAVKWIKHCLYDMIFDKERVEVLLEKYLSSIVELKREGDIMMSSIMDRNFFSSKSMKKSADALFAQAFLEDIMERIKNGDYESTVLPMFETVREQLRNDFKTFHVLIFGDVNKLEDLYGPWQIFASTPEYSTSGNALEVPAVPRLINSLSKLGQHPGKAAYLITTPASESSYMTVVAKTHIGLTYDHPDIPAITLAAQYLECVEGPFWKGIRGAGMAYGASMLRLAECDVLEFVVYRAADVIGGFNTAREIVNALATGQTEFETHLMKGAMSSVINSIATSEPDYFSSALTRYVDDFCKQRGPKYNHTLIKRLNTVSAKDLQRVMKDYFVPLFISASSAVFMSCHPSKADAVTQFLEKEGYNVKLEELEEDSEDEEEGGSSDESETDDEAGSDDASNTASAK